MARSRWKFLYFNNKLWKLSLKRKIRKRKGVIKNFNTFNKSSCIPRSLLYSYMTVHKGNSTINKRINKFMIGKKFGEFVFTRKPFFFPPKKKKVKR